MLNEIIPWTYTLIYHLDIFFNVSLSINLQLNNAVIVFGNQIEN